MILNISYFIMEYFEGEQLDTFIENNGSMSKEELMKWVKSLSDWVSRLHNKKLFIMTFNLKKF